METGANEKLSHTELLARLLDVETQADPSM